MKFFKKYGALFALVLAITTFALPVMSHLAYAAEPGTSVEMDAENGGSAQLDSVAGEISGALDNILAGLTLCTDPEAGKWESAKSYQQISELYDQADVAYADGRLTDAEYDALMELMAEKTAGIMEQYERFGFDPYGTELAYEAPAAYMMDNSFVQASFDAGRKAIILNCYFDCNMSQAGMTGYIYGATRMNSYGKGYTIASVNSRHAVDYVTTATLSSYVGSWYNGMTSTGHIFVYAVSGLGAIELNGGYISSRKAAFIVVVTDPEIIKNINAAGGKWNGSYWGYAADDTEATWSSSSPSYTAKAIENWSGTYTQWYESTQHTHSWAWTSNASSHWQYCTSGDGATQNSGSHNSNVTDTTSKAGYTLKKCSVCNYAVSTTANVYGVTLDNSGAYTAGTTSVNATFNAAMPSITVPYRTGYTFGGYYSGQNGSGTKYYNADGTSAHVYDIAGAGKLYPNWIRAYDIEVTDTAANAFAFKGV